MSLPPSLCLSARRWLGTALHSQQLTVPLGPANAGQAINETVRPFGVEDGISWETRVKLLGLPGPSWAEIVIADCDLSGQLEAAELLERWHAALDALVPSLTSRLPGVDQLVGMLLAAGVPQGIATSSTREAVTAKSANHAVLFGSMASVVCGDELPAGGCGKPAPDIYLLAAERLGVRVNPQPVPTIAWSPGKSLSSLTVIVCSRRTALRSKTRSPERRQRVSTHAIPTTTTSPGILLTDCVWVQALRA